MKFEQTLEKTYYNHGFFNVKVDYDGFIRKSNGPIAIQLGYGGHAIPGRVNRTANLNNTARIHGRSELRNWFQANFQIGDELIVDVQAPEHIVLLRK